MVHVQTEAQGVRILTPFSWLRQSAFTAVQGMKYQRYRQYIGALDEGPRRVLPRRCRIVFSEIDRLPAGQGLEVDLKLHALRAHLISRLLAAAYLPEDSFGRPNMTLQRAQRLLLCTIHDLAAHAMPDCFSAFP